jgi:hypothetical protein
LFALLLLVAALSSNTALAQEHDVRNWPQFQQGLARLAESIAVADRSSDQVRANQLSNHRARLAASEQSKKAAEAVTVSNAVESVSAVARCAAGYVATHRVDPGAPDVTVASARGVDCDRNGCRAVQVDAERASRAPFSVTVSVSCSG